MATCKECIHEKLCVIKAFPDAFENTQWDKEPCDHFKPIADVVPKSEVALDVIRKVKNKVRKYKHNVVNPYEHIILYLNELEKKYTEENK
jgi:hypothetical protein